ncbi:MAG: TetR/AcrR family transcriptional regulator C-terminal domain-containing protein [Actinomycetota bacterium]
MTATSTNARAPLDAERIIETAIAIADAEGVDALTMRRLADELGYKVMALYRHVANKDELLASMVDEVAAAILVPGADTPPLQGIREHCISTRDVFVRHPWAPGLWLHHTPGANRIEHMEYLLAAFGRSGLPHELGHHGYHAVVNHVLGYTLQAQKMDESIDGGSIDDLARAFMDSLDAERHPHTIAHVQEHLDGDTGPSFELVLDLILDGLVRLAEH